MDCPPSECRKSLDQLLEQALAERSREDDQVEVTYELTGEPPRDSRGHRLRPPEVGGSNTPSRKRREEEEAEETEDAVGSIQLERKASRNTIVLGIATLLCTSGFVALQSLQSSLFSNVGLQSLATLYILATISCLMAPYVDQALGITWTFILMSVMQAIYVLVFHFYHPASLIICAIFLGLIYGSFIRTQQTFLSRNMSRLSYVTQAMRTKTQQRFLKAFFMISKSHFFVGNLVATVIMELANHPDVDTSALSNSTEVTVPIIQPTELCSERLCQDQLYRREADTKYYAKEYNLASSVTEIFLYVFVSCIGIGVILVVLFVERIDVFQEQDPMERSLFHQTVRQIRLILLDKNVRLAVPIFIFIGVEQAFIFGDFTRAYISCALGLESVGFTMMCLGAAHTLGSVGVHLFSQHFPRPIIMAAGLVCQSGLLMVLWLWTPAKDDAAVVYVISGGWGLCNAIWETLTLTFLAMTFADDWHAPFCTYHQLQWLGMGLMYLVSPYLCAERKIFILAAGLGFSLIPYTVVEFQMFQRSRMQNPTNML